MYLNIYKGLKLMRTEAHKLGTGKYSLTVLRSLLYVGNG